MKQVYNLLETIEQDKEAVSKLKKQLHHAESILEVHTAALTRLTATPKLSQPEVDKVSLSSAQEFSGKIRVTMENVLDLGIEVGDTIEIVRTADCDFEDGQRCTIKEVDFDKINLPFKLYPIKSGSTNWYDFEYNMSQPRDHELYLIKSQGEK